MSIVRIGMSEDGKFGDGYDAIFGKKEKDGAPAKGADKSATVKKPAAKKSETAKKSEKKKA